jgi:hypothetical protein
MEVGFRLARSGFRKIGTPWFKPGRRLPDAELILAPFRGKAAESALAVAKM